MTTPFLPDEVFGRILAHLHPDYILESIARACQRLYLLANDPLLWRGICISHFRAFSSEHAFETLLKRPAREVDWLALYRLRKRRNVHALQLLNDMTKSPMVQLDKMDALFQYDYDVKELLIEQAQSDPCQEDGFARAYWARRILETIHRHRGVLIWTEMRDPARGPEGFCRPTPEHLLKATERGHAAFDMFVLHESWCDVDWISAKLDDMTESLRSAVPDFDGRCTRSKALMLNLWLRRTGFTGLRNHGSYRNLRNCLLGQALRHPEHETIPITSAAIYCAIAMRLNMLADPWLNPGHVIVCVRPYPGQTLEGDEVQAGQTASPMYLDPWGQDTEISCEDVTPFTVPMTWYSRARRGLTHPVETVLRVHNNILATNNVAESRFAHFNSDLGELSSGHSQLNLLAAQYATLWARIMLADPHEIIVGNIPPPYDKLTSMLVNDFPEDVTWAERYLGVLVESNPERFPPNWNEMLQRTFITARRRCADDDYQDGYSQGDCEVTSGQVFRHKRNGNIGLIFRAKMPETLPSTGKADFFECQFADRPGENFIVAQQNIEILTDANMISPAMFPRAGRCFKRFDKAQCRFIPIQAIH